MNQDNSLGSGDRGVSDFKFLEALVLSHLKLKIRRKFVFLFGACIYNKIARLLKLLVFCISS